MGCFGASSRVCFPDLQEKIEAAKATPEGPDRARLMEEIADIAHDEFMFIPFIQVQLVYGLAANLEWEPLYAPRVRVNTMRFTRVFSSGDAACKHQLGCAIGPTGVSP
jgi:hypothetical protein